MPLPYITKMAECDCCFVDPTGQKHRKDSLHIAWQELGKNGGKCKMHGPQSALCLSLCLCKDLILQFVTVGHCSFQKRPL